MPKAPKITTLGVHIKTTGAGPTKHLCHWFSSPKPKLGWWLRIHPWPWNNWEKSCERKKFIPSYTILSNYYHPLIYIYTYPLISPWYPIVSSYEHSKPHGWPWKTLSAHRQPQSSQQRARRHTRIRRRDCYLQRPTVATGWSREGEMTDLFQCLGVCLKKKITLQKPQKKKLQHQNQRDDYLLDDLQWQFPIFWIDVCLFPAKNQRNCGGTSGKCGHEDPPTAVCVRTIWPSNLEIENKKSERPTHVSTSPEFPATSSTRMPHPNCYQQAMTFALGVS